MTGAASYGLYVVLALIAGGLFLALPSDRPLNRRFFWSGMVVAAGGLAGVAVYVVRWLGTGFEGRVFFAVFAVLAVAAAIRVVTHSRPVYSAVYLVLVVLAVTGLCVLAAAEFLAAALVIVYGGAILVTYIFVIMLAQQAGEAYYDTRAREPLAAVVMGFALMAAAAQAMTAKDPIALHAAGGAQRGARASVLPGSEIPPALGGRRVAPHVEKTLDDYAQTGNVRAVGAVLMRDYMIAAQIAGLLMLVAMVGAIAIARKKIDVEDLTTYEQSQLQEVGKGRPGLSVEPYAEVRPGEHG